MTDLSRQESHIHSVVQESLLSARHLADAGLTSESRDDALARYLSVLSQAEAWQVHIASDGLSLDHKIALEKHLLGNLAQAFPDVRFAIYYKRIQAPMASPRQVAGPESLGAAPAPFGLQMARRAIPGVREIIVVASGKGGVGKSTVSCNLAVALGMQDQRVGLLDADIYGPSAPTMLGLKGAMPVDSTHNKVIPLEAHGVKTVSFGFLSDAYNPVVWRGPLVAKAIKQLCYDVDWGRLDYLIIDLPPGTGDVQLSLIESLPIHGAVIVTTPQDVALIDAHKALSMFTQLGVPVLGVVENMAMYTCSQCGHQDAIFGEGGVSEFAQSRALPIIASVPLHPAIRMSGDAGQPISLQRHSPQGKVFAALARRLIQGS